MRLGVNRNANRVSSTGPQRWYIRNVSDAAHGVHVVDFKKESVLRSANAIERHRSNLFALAIIECRKISGEPNSVQFRLADWKIHLRRGAYAVNAMYASTTAAIGMMYLVSDAVLEIPAETPLTTSVVTPMGLASDPSP